MARSPGRPDCPRYLAGAGTEPEAAVAQPVEAGRLLGD